VRSDAVSVASVRRQSREDAVMYFSKVAAEVENDRLKSGDSGQRLDLMSGGRQTGALAMTNGFTASHYVRRERLKKQIAARTAKINGIKTKYHLLESNDNFKISDIPARTTVLMRSTSLDQAQ